MMIDNDRNVYSYDIDENMWLEKNLHKQDVLFRLKLN